MNPSLQSTARVILGGPLLLLFLLYSLVACDHGLVPPDAPDVGAIRVEITYRDYQTAWPAPGSIFDLRFVAMPFIPKDTSDLLQLNLLVLSESLNRFNRRPGDTLTISNVRTGTFVYSGVAEQFADDIFSWRPVGLVTDHDGVFEVRAGDTARVMVAVDFRNRPPFPP